LPFMARSVGITREQVIAVAAELADAHGLDQLALAHVAAQLGVRLPSLYNHVDGLAGLRRELTLLGLRDLLQRLSHAAIGKAGDEAVMSIAQAYRRFAFDRPGLYTATVAAAAPEDLPLQQAAQAILDVVLAVLAPYGLEPEAAIHAIRGLRSVCHGFATLELAGGFGMPLDRDESYVRLVHTYIAGLRREGLSS
jgi:AcrR family transcriptional regulator